MHTGISAAIALVIGCGDMGMACARVLGRRQPLLMVDIDGERLDASVSILRHDGYQVTGLQCDVTDPRQVDALGAHLAQLGGVGVLLHVAAIGRSPEGGEKILDVDLAGPHRIAHMAEPHMVGGGVVILISSTGSYMAPVDPDIDALLEAPLAPGFFAQLCDAFGRVPDELESYFMAKKGVNLLAEKLALAWASRKVRVLSVSPGMIDSTMGRTSGAEIPLKVENGRVLGYGPRAEKVQTVPLGRQGSLLEVAAVVDFLASDGASFMTGIDIPVDGGSVAGMRRRRFNRRKL